MKKKLERKLWIKANIPEGLWRDYHWQIQNRIRTKEQLEKYIRLLPEEIEGIERTKGIYPMAITPYYLSLIDPYDPMDPIRLQAIPRVVEVDESVQRYGEPDALKEDGSISGLTHRYPDRVLVQTTTFCAVYCRHCMRKRIFSQGEKAISEQQLRSIIEYVESHPEIREVLLSGGDPLTLSPEKLDFILWEFRRIPHVEVIRIGTRLPVLAPQRFFDEDVLRVLEKHSPIWVNTHFNHPREVTLEAQEAVENLLRRGVPVLNQTVLLKGVNDNPEIMLELMKKLIRIKVKPQYLFHCDPIKGVIHFRTSLEKGLEIMKYLRGRISGYAIPTYAVDLPGGKGKVPLLPKYLIDSDGTKHTFLSWDEQKVEYDICEF